MGEILRNPDQLQTTFWDRGVALRARAGLHCNRKNWAKRPKSSAVCKKSRMDAVSDLRVTFSRNGHERFWISP